MTSLSPAPTSTAVSQSGSAGTPTVVGSTSTQQQPQQQRSYAHATRPSRSIATQDQTDAPVIVGANQHGKGDTVNGRTSAPNMAAPTIVNSGGPPFDHTRKTSVTISAAGASGQLSNGAPTPSTKHNISFGSMNAPPGSPAIANSSASNRHPSSSLPAPTGDPRITSPAASPTPIPPPPASSGGDKPPARSQAQSNGMTFGSMGGPEGDANRQSHNPSAMMPGQNSHFRRTSSHSQHGDMSGMQMNSGPNRGGYMGGPPRGRGFTPGHPQQMPYQQQYSPNNTYRQMQTPQRPGSGIPPHMNVGPHPGTPHGQPRSPGPMGSGPNTPNMQHMQMHQGQNMYPSYGAYQQQLPGQPGQFAMQQPYQDQYGYYTQPYQMPPQYLPGPSQSPRSVSFSKQQQMPSQQFGPGQFNQPPSQNMSRTNSQVSERPTSSIGSAQPPVQPSGTPSIAQSSHAHNPSASAASQFQIPQKRASKGIVIRKPDSGEVVNLGSFDTKKPSPAPAAAKSPSPAPVEATPPSRSTSTTSQSHNRSDSKSGKSAAEIRAEFAESVRKEQEREPTIKEESAVTKDKDAAPSQSESSESRSDEQQATHKLAADEQAQSRDPSPAKADSKQPPSVPTIERDDASEAGNESSADAASSKSAIAASDSKSTVSSARSEVADETDEQKKKREDDEEMERMIAEMEAAEKEEEERERAFNEKKAKEKAAREKEDAETADARMKQAERDAEALEEARQRRKAQADDGAEDSVEGDKSFASLKKPDIGPGAETVSKESTPEPEAVKTPTSEDQVGAMPPPRTTRLAGGAKPKPAALKLETVKTVEPAQPTPGMRSLRSARMLQLQNESVVYPEGIQSPNPAINQSGRRGGRLYDKDFLLQFQEAFKEKPFVDWDKKLVETLGDPHDPQKSARTPGPRTPANRVSGPSFGQHGVMGTFTNPVGGRTLPPGTTSKDRFDASNSGSRTMSNPLQHHFPGGFGRGGAQMGGRQPSVGNVGLQPSSSRGSTRGRGGQQASNQGGRQPTRHQLEQANSKMPLTAGTELKPLDLSNSGWKPTSVGKPASMANAVDPSGHMAPDMVQRKVKSNLNKMTPERFDKIADQIQAIAAQSKDETDGRTLRQVIALLFEKACDEAHWASMYAKFAKRMLEEMTPEIKDENVRDKSDAPVVGGALFRKYLLNRCQEEFERGWETNLPLDAEGQKEEAVMLSDEYYKAAAAKRKGLGLVQFIGELYKLRMLSIKIMHQCVTKLLDFEGEPDEASIEGLVKLLRTVGGPMESEKEGPPLIKVYFERIDNIMSSKHLPSRMHFMLLDVVDLRRTGWRSKDDAKGPKTIQEIRDEAVIAQQKADAERQRQNQRGGGRMPSGRGDARNFGSPMPPPDYAKNNIGTDDLRKLSQRKESRQGAGGPSRSLGPTSMLGSRSSSGRQGFGPPGGLLSRNESGAGSSAGSSGMHSRTASIKADKKEDEPKANANVFSALSGMDGDAESTPASSPPATKSQPATSSDSKVSEQPKSEVGSKEASS